MLLYEECIHITQYQVLETSYFRTLDPLLQANKELVPLLLSSACYLYSKEAGDLKLLKKKRDRNQASLLGPLEKYSTVIRINDLYRLAEISM